MYKIILCSLFLVGSFAMAHEGHMSADRPSIHGMAVVGHHKVYLSHLPMFHSPHDYQVILEVEFDAEAKAIYDSSVTSATPELYTLAPDENFVLPAMVQVGNSFPATLFKGHSERGGTAIVSGLQVKIVQVLYFKKFQPGKVQPEQAQYLFFGNDKEQFLAHIVTAKPDFDQIVNLQPTEVLAKSGPVEMTLPHQKNVEPLKADSKLTGILKSDNSPIELNVLSVIYFESGDLSF